MGRDLEAGVGVAACFRKTWRLSPGLFPGFITPDFASHPGLFEVLSSLSSLPSALQS